MSAIGNVLSLPNNLDRLIIQFKQEVLRDLSKKIKDDEKLSEATSKKLNFLITLLDYESEKNLELSLVPTSHGDTSEDPSYEHLRNIWSTVADKYFSATDCSQHRLSKFLISCLRHVPDSSIRYCVDVIRTLISMATRSLTEDGEKNVATGLLHSLNLAEAFLNSVTIDANISDHQKSMLSFLCDTLLQADEILVESSYHLRIAGLLSSGLENLRSEEFVGIIFHRVIESFSVKADLIMKSVMEENNTLIQCCMVLLSFLLDVTGKDAVNSEVREIKSKTLLSLPDTWLIIQKGLKNFKPVIRKQALYNLRKALSISAVYSNPIVAQADYESEPDSSRIVSPIFFWNSLHQEILDAFWRDFLLLGETLEENQLHVIAPVLKKLRGLISMVSSHRDKLNSSWICVLLERMMSHESKAVTREGVILSLQLDQSELPFLDQCFGFHFLYNGSKGGLLPALQDVNLYCDFKEGDAPTETTELPEVACHLQEFMVKCVSSYASPADFVNFLLEAAVKVNWGAVPLYYFCKALSSLPKCGIWSIEELKNLQSLVVRCSRTHDFRLRHMIQNLLLQSMMNFTDCSKVCLDDILNIIALSNSKGFLSHFVKLWNEISQWIYRNFESFSSLSSGKAEDICVFTLKKLERYCLPSSQQVIELLSLDDIKKQSATYALLVLSVERATFINKDGIGEEFLKHVLLWFNDITEKASTHLYMPKEKVHKAVAILNHLVTAWFEDVGWSDKKCGTLYNELFKILKNLSYAAMRSSAVGGVEEAKFFLDTWRKLFSLLVAVNPSCQWPHQLVMEFSHLTSVSWDAYSTFQKYDFSKGEQSWNATLNGVVFLSWMSNLVEDFGIKLNDDLSTYLGEFLSTLDLNGEIVSRNSKEKCFGKEIEWYNTMMWSCVPFCIKLQKLQKDKKLIDCIQGLRHFLNRLDTVTENNIPTYMRALGTMITQVLEEESEEKDHEELICQCIEISWRTVDGLAHSPAFWKSYRSFTAAIFQKSTLSLHDSSPIQEKLSSLFQEIAMLSTSKPGLIEHACAKCLRSWTECSNKAEHQPPKSHCFPMPKSYFSPICKLCTVNSDWMIMQPKFIAQCLTFSIVRKKEDLALLNTLKLEEKRRSALPALIEQSSEHLVTISTIAMMLQLRSDLKADREFCLVIIYELLNLDEAIAKKKSRYHHNSIQHHVKNKIFQTVVLLLPFVSLEEAAKIINFFIDALKRDAQPSVRYYMEWALALLILRFESFQDVLLKQLTDCGFSNSSSDTSGGGAKFSAICSFLTVALFLGLGKSDRIQEMYFLDLINICLPWCMTQHFSIRLYALAVILRIKIYFENIGKYNYLVEKYPALPACLLFADNATGNVAKNWIKMKDNFFIFDFHPVEDLSLETVFIDFPRLCGLPNHFSVDDLHAIACTAKSENFVFRSSIHLFNQRSCLRFKTNTKWIPQESKHTTENFISQDMRYRKNYGAQDLTEDFSNHMNVGDNVQKKIMPWLDTAENDSRESQFKKRPKGLIVVASLIDKASNLGGLARTCEIFGAEALVVQALSCTSDKLFQSLAVTAHKWLPMKEVKPWQLEDYLRRMRKEGYTLVGTEQTAQSVCLSKYRFPERCVVLLGNEKEGVPISLLKVLDVCVQIPQKGIIRSLNVHVSGAVTVWEYARQHLG